MEGTIADAGAAGIVRAEVLPASGAALTLEEGTAVEDIVEEVTESTAGKTADDTTPEAAGGAEDQKDIPSADQPAAQSEDTDSVISAQSVSGGNSTEELSTEDGRSMKEVLACAGAEEVVELNTLTVSAGLGIEKLSEEEIASAEARKLADITTEAVTLGAQVTREIKDAEAAAIAEAEARDPEHFSNLVIAQVSSCVNVRDIPSTDGEVVGKLYDKSVGTFIEEENGWYKISSGNVTGYVNAEYCVTGEEAIELAKKVGTRLAVVNTTTLKVRMEPSTDASVLTLVPIEEDLVVLDELDGWVKVTCEDGDGYVSAEYVDLHTEFVKAESKAEEEARLAKEAEERRAARAAAERAVAQRTAAANNNRTTTTQNTTVNRNDSYTAPAISGSGLGSDVAKYACQFVGNPYVYGGSSLTNGTDCSGFVMSVYKAYGVSLPHSSREDRGVGAAVEGGLANAQPGDIVCYSGHVALYIGNGQIVHASNSRTGIIISNASYKNVLAVRRIF
ncbi:MAG: C40 family peptidase [Lachnospiraceae bacterium]|nr:C40 family peptidase [Lachnospiraceae bacterium]